MPSSPRSKAACARRINKKGVLLLTRPNNANDNESDLYYKNSLNPVFTALKVDAYITIARWSYIPGADNPKVFSPGEVGKMDRKQVLSIQQAFDTEEFKRALREFSFTKLLVENDQEIWFHFTDENPPGIGDRQVYVGSAPTGIKNVPIIEVAAKNATPRLVTEIIEAFGHSIKLVDKQADLLYGKIPLKGREREIMDTLNAAIFSLFRNEGTNIRHIYFMPVLVEAGMKKVVGIISINSSVKLPVTMIQPILQPSAQGIMAAFHLREIDEERKKFSLRSAIAAIMSRNMSHNIGSHVLWHLAQDLKGQ
jgi:hypothetical protein